MPLVVHDPKAGAIEVPNEIEAAGPAAIAEYLTKKTREAGKAPRPSEPRTAPEE